MLLNIKNISEDNTLRHSFQLAYISIIEFLKIHLQFWCPTPIVPTSGHRDEETLAEPLALARV